MGKFRVSFKRLYDKGFLLHVDDRSGTGTVGAGGGHTSFLSLLSNLDRIDSDFRLNLLLRLSENSLGHACVSINLGLSGDEDLGIASGISIDASLLLSDSSLEGVHTSAESDFLLSEGSSNTSLVGTESSSFLSSHPDNSSASSFSPHLLDSL